VDHNHLPYDPGHTHQSATGVMSDNINGGPYEKTFEYLDPADSPTGYYNPGGSAFDVRYAGTNIQIHYASVNQATGNTMEFSVQYVDVIIASKN
jgi:hypothetical protein